VSTSEDQALYTLADWERSKSRCKEIKDEILALQEELSEEEANVAFGDRLIKKRGGASVFITYEPSNPQPAVQAPETLDRVTWTEEITHHVTEAGIISYPKLRQKVADGPLGKRLARSDKGFYGALAKLEMRGVLIRHNDHAFTLTAFEDYERQVEAGEREEIVSETASRSSPMSAAILDYLAKQARPMKSIEILSFLRAQPPFSKTLKGNSGSLYNNLARLVARGILIKDDDRKTYSLPPNEEGSDDSEPSQHEGAGWVRQASSCSQAEGSIPSASTPISQSEPELALSPALNTNPLSAQRRERRLA